MRILPADIIFTQAPLAKAREGLSKEGDSFAVGSMKNIGVRVSIAATLVFMAMTLAYQTAAAALKTVTIIPVSFVGLLTDKVPQELQLTELKNHYFNIYQVAIGIIITPFALLTPRLGFRLFENLNLVLSHLYNDSLPLDVPVLEQRNEPAPAQQPNVPVQEDSDSEVVIGNNAPPPPPVFGAAPPAPPMAPIIGSGAPPPPPPPGVPFAPPAPGVPGAPGAPGGPMMSQAKLTPAQQHEVNEKNRIKREALKRANPMNFYSATPVAQDLGSAYKMILGLLQDKLTGDEAKDVDTKKTISEYEQKLNGNINLIDRETIKKDLNQFTNSEMFIILAIFAQKLRTEAEEHSHIDTDILYGKHKKMFELAQGAMGQYAGTAQIYRENAETWYKFINEFHADYILVTLDQRLKDGKNVEHLPRPYDPTAKKPKKPVDKDAAPSSGNKPIDMVEEMKRVQEKKLQQVKRNP